MTDEINNNLIGLNPHLLPGANDLDENGDVPLWRVKRGVPGMGYKDWMHRCGHIITFEQRQLIPPTSCPGCGWKGIARVVNLPIVPPFPYMPVNIGKPGKLKPGKFHVIGNMQKKK